MSNSGCIHGLDILVCTARGGRPGQWESSAASHHYEPVKPFLLMRPYPRPPVRAALSFPVARVLALEGPCERALAEASAANAASLVALSLPLGIKALPSHLVALLRTCRGAVLVLKEALPAPTAPAPHAAAVQ